MLLRGVLGPALSPGGGANTPNEGSVVVVEEAEQTARFLCGAQREVDPTIGPREKRVQSSGEDETLSCGCYIVEGETELTAQLSDPRAQPCKMLNSMMMTRGMGSVGGSWVGDARAPFHYSIDTCDTALRVPRLRTAPKKKLTDFQFAVRSASSTETSTTSSQPERR